MVGREYEGGTLKDGVVRIQFNNPGYRYLAEFQSGTARTSSSINSRIEVEYDFPSISIPFVDNEKSKDDVVVIVYYNTGKFSEDLKTLHFDTFTVSQDSFSTVAFQDVTFTRK